MFDAHNHLHFPEFDSDREPAIARAVAAGVTGMLIAGYDFTRQPLAAELGRRPGIGAAAGLHPWAVSDDDAPLRNLRSTDWGEFCAVGELGLDWVREKTAAGRERQIEVFRAQLDIAREVHLPVVVHCVAANDELAKWLAKDGVPGRGGIIHGFWGSAQQARRFVDLGLHLSIGTQLTRSCPDRMARALALVGIDALVVETDAPSRPPRGVEGPRNEPAYLPCVVEAVALTLGTTATAVAAATERTARQLFDLRGTLASPES